MAIIGTMDLGLGEDITSAYVRVVDVIYGTALKYDNEGSSAEVKEVKVEIKC